MAIELVSNFAAKGDLMNPVSRSFEVINSASGVKRDPKKLEEKLEITSGSGVKRDPKKLEEKLEINSGSGVKRDLKKLEEKLKLIQAMLSDAERRQPRDEAVRLWLKQLKSAAYQVEDMLDEFAFETLRRKLELQNRMKNKVRYFFSPSNPIAFRFKMAHKVENVNMKLDGIYREAADDLKLVVQELSPLDVTTDHGPFRKCHPFVDDSKIVGREADVSKVVDKLISANDEAMSIVSIWGMAGIGKTTLAQLVYENEMVVSHFNERMWVCVSDNFDVERLLKEMVESLTRGSCEMSNAEGMIKKLQEKLKGKKFLLVLDDVCNEDHQKWERMRSYLLEIGASRGSKIIVTTRWENVAPPIYTILTYRLAALSDDDGWTIFEQRAFASGGPTKTLNLVDIGRMIVNKCGGVPLAIKTMGALVYSKNHESEWLSVLDYAIWNSSAETGFPNFLMLSYDYLPSRSLKECFAYCSIFPKDFNIEKDNLIQLWMAQGYLRPPQGSNLLMEDIGNDYFSILLWNSFFQDVEMDAYGNIMTCKVHDLVHELAQSVSSSECLIVETVNKNNNLKEVCHLSLISNGDTEPTIPKEYAQKLRTFFSQIDVFGNMSLKFKCLHSLSLYGTDIEELPSSISKLIHLRYLQLSETRIKRFPRSFAKLYNLQTLRLINCYNLVELPQDLRNMVSLRHLYTYKRFDKMPKEIGKLTSLQTLPVFVVGSERGCHIEELGYLKELRGELTIYNLEQVRDSEAAKRANLAGKPYLYKLKFVWNGREEEGSNNDEDVLEGLQPHLNLKSLTIENFMGGKYASWMPSMSSSSSHDGSTLLNNMVELKLKNCKKCEKIPTLGQLSHLKILEICRMENVYSIGAEFYGDNDRAGSSSAGCEEATTLFPALTRFKLSDMHNLVEWLEAVAGPSVVFPRLEELIIVECPQLKSAPSNFPSLKKLKIDGINSSMPLAKICSNLTTLSSLHIEKVSELSILPEGILQNNTNLESLTIRKCEELISIVAHQHLVLGCTSLRSLYIGHCEKLSYLWEGLYTLTSLEDLEIESCHSLSSIPRGLGFTSLRRLEIWKCDGLTSLPSGLQSCTCLEFLTISRCSNLISVLAEDLQELHSLVSLYIGCCPKLECFPEESLGCLTRLKELRIGGFSSELEAFPGLNSIQHLHAALEELVLVGWDKLKSLPDQLQHLTALKQLTISEFNGVEALPEWLGNLSSLENLQIWFCDNLMYLSTVEAMRRLTKLKSLQIGECPKLKERCTRGIGPEWSKISHIPSVHFESIDDYIRRMFNN